MLMAEAEIYEALSITSAISSWLTISRTVDSYYSLAIKYIGWISIIVVMQVFSLSVR